MLFYILMIALLNLGLGFATAYYLGQRHSMRVAGSGGPWTQASRSVPARDPAVVEQVDSAPSPQPARQMSPGEQSVDDIKSRLLEHLEEMRSIDEQLRSASASPQAAQIRSCLAPLETANADYLQRRDQAHQAFEGLHESDEEFEDIRASLQEAVQQQSKQIDEVQEAADSFDYEGDLEDGCRRIMDQVGKLVDAGYSLLDTLGTTRVEVLRSQKVLGSDELALEKDRLTGIPGRLGLEAKLQQWWEKDPHLAQRLSVAMLDVDQFAKLNRTHGYQPGDRILRALAQLMTTECSDNDTLARFGGSTFSFVFPEKDTSYATSVIEQIRQTIEMIHFQRQKCDIQVTVSCAVTAVQSEDTPQTLLTRARQTAAEASRSGGNRTHMHDGQKSAPIVPPNLTMAEKTISL